MTLRILPTPVVDLPPALIVNGEMSRSSVIVERPVYFPDAVARLEIEDGQDAISVYLRPEAARALGQRLVDLAEGPS